MCTLSTPSASPGRATVNFRTFFTGRGKYGGSCSTFRPSFEDGDWKKGRQPSEEKSSPQTKSWLRPRPLVTVSPSSIIGTGHKGWPWAWAAAWFMSNVTAERPGSTAGSLTNYGTIFDLKHCRVSELFEHKPMTSTNIDWLVPRH